MKLVDASFEIIDGLDDPEAIMRKIELCARNCYKSEGKIGPNSHIKLIKKLIKREHFTTLEFHDVIVRFIIDRGISHELVRHRLCSFLQESSRYCDYGDGHVCFVIPYFCDVIEPGIYDPADRDMSLPVDEAEWYNAMMVAEEYYKQLRDESIGLAPQGARDVLPNSLKTEVICKANLREWRHIFKLRCNPAAHPDMVKIMRAVRQKFCDVLPVIFLDLMDGDECESKEA